MKLALAAFALLIFALFTRFGVLQILRGWKRLRTHLSPRDALDMAGGGTLLVGEFHSDREALPRIAALLAAAHERGYRTLGVEVCHESCDKYSGLDEELAALEALGPHGAIPPYDARSSLDPKEATGAKPRMNRYWYMRVALRFGWKIVSVDPNHWAWIPEDKNGYIDQREFSMAEALRQHRPLIAVCGYGHLQGLHKLMAEEVEMVMASPARKEDAGGDPIWEAPIAYAATLPQLDV